MKKTKPFNSLIKVCSGIIFILMIFLLGSCSGKVIFLPSSVVPAAKGYVKLKKDKNENYVIQVHITDLAKVEWIQPPKQTYVVWLLSKQATTENLGKIESSTSSFSNKLKADFETSSSTKPMKIFITTENNASTQFPGDQIVLSTDNIFKN